MVTDIQKHAFAHLVGADFARLSRDGEARRDWATNWSSASAEGYAAVVGVTGPAYFAEPYTNTCSFNGRVVCLQQ